MKALVIAPQPFFSPRGTPFSVYYRALVMSESGVQIDLLTYGEGQDIDMPGVRLIRIPRFRFLEPVKIGPSAPKLFFDVFLLLWTIGLLLRNRYDFVHAHEEAVFFCRYLKPLFRFKLIYDMHSSLPQQLTNFKFTKSKLLIGAFRYLEDSCLSAADAVITICPELAEYAEPRVCESNRHFLIENSIFEAVRLKNGGGAGGESETSLPGLPRGRRIVGYAGTFEAYQGLHIVIEGFAQARRNCPEAFLLLVGGAPEQVSHYRELAHRQGLDDHCLFTGRVDPDTARALMKRADVLTSPRIEGTNTPLKIYEQLASGIPLVATRILSHTQVLSDAVCFLVEPTAEGFAMGLVDALTDQVRRDSTVVNALALYDKDYSRPAYEQKIRKLLGVVS